MQTFILQQNPLTDNLLLLADQGKVFKGNYIAIIKEYVFLNSWCDKLTVTRFRKEESLKRYLAKRYKSLDIDF
jgi:hypothetical protein